MNRKTLLFSLALTAAGLGYLLHVSFPEPCEFPLGVKLFYIAVKGLDAMGRISTMFGGCYWTIMKPRYIPNVTVEGVQMEFHDINGIEYAIIQPEDFSKKSAGAAMIFYHGGGWILGSVGSYATLMKNLAKSLGMLIVVPEYRLAPEFLYPIPFQDVMRVTEEFMKRAKEFNVNPRKIVLAGDSAGGNLAMAISLALSDRNSSGSKALPKICMLNLVYPVLQMSNFMLPSYLQNHDPPMLTPTIMIRAFLTYLGLDKHTELIGPMLNNAHMDGVKDEDMLKRISEKWIPEKYKKRTYVSTGSSVYTSLQLASLKKYRKKLQKFASNPHISPLSVNDSRLRELPYTHIFTCEFDVLRDDGTILYERLRSLGMPATHQHLDFGAHGLLSLYGLTSYEKLDNAVEVMMNKILEGVNKC